MKFHRTKAPDSQYPSYDLNAVLVLYELFFTNLSQPKLDHAIIPFLTLLYPLPLVRPSNHPKDHL